MTQQISLPPVRIGLLGAGNISGRYVEGMRRFGNLDVVGVADLNEAAARALAAEYGLRMFSTPDALLADPAVEVVVNITPPAVHAQVSLQAVAAGKHVYVEKPIATSVSDSAAVLSAARESDVLVGSAPDTFLGSAAQTARAAIDHGLIGEPIAATAFITHNRVEEWHPDPSFLFRAGGGPILDLGPYYITTLVSLLGPIGAVAGMTRFGPDERVFTSPDRRVESVRPEVPTHASATLQFRSGVLGTLVASFDVWDSHLPKIEIYGDRGTLTLPDPNEYDGPVLLRTRDSTEWIELPPSTKPFGAPGTSEQFLRGAGVADLVGAIHGAPLRASGELAHHILEVLSAIPASQEQGATISINSQPERPAAIQEHAIR